MAYAFDLAGITNAVGAHPVRFWRRVGTANAYATGFVQNGQKSRRQQRLPPLRKTQG